MWILLLVFLLFSNQVSAAVYYVSSDGGTISQCSGLVDHSLAGATGTNCRVSHPAWLLGTGSAGVFAAGDTMILDNVDTAGSGQAKYVVGYTMPNLTGCNTVVSDFDCQMQPIPAGVDSSHKTKIYGKGAGSCSSTATNQKAQIWGQGRVSPLSFAGGNVDIECLEITDHSSCIENGPSDGNTISGDPVKCVRTGVSLDDGNWAPTGLVFNASGGSSNVIITDVDIHGMAARPIYARRFGDATVTNSNFIANGYVGWDSDLAGDDSYTGTITFDTVKIQFSGCGENYPRTDWNWDSTTDLHHCWSQSQGGYGDGIGLGDGDPGSWVIRNSSISWNTSDGVDMLHGTGLTGTLIFDRSRAEGNAGQQIKAGLLNSYIENSFINGNCAFMWHQSFTSTKDSSGSSVGFDICRANGDTITFPNQVAGQKLYINNSTILSNGDSAIITSGDFCNGTTVLQMRNTIVYEGRQAADDQAIVGGAGGNDTSGFYFRAGRAGTNDGPCTTYPLIDEDYDFIFGAKANTGQCATGSSYSNGVHSDCTHDPLFAVAPAMGPTNYINTTAGISNYYIQTTSPARDFADETISTLQNGSADFNSFARGASWDDGAFEYGTVSSSCNSNGDACSGDGDCCSNICTVSVCVSGSGGGGNTSSSGQGGIRDITLKDILFR